MVLHTSCGAVCFVFSTLSARLLKIYSCLPALSIGFTKSLQNRRKTMLFVLASSPSPSAHCVRIHLSQRERPWQRDELCVDCQGLPLWGSWHRVAMTERASPLTKRTQKSSPFRGSWHRAAMTERVLISALRPAPSAGAGYPAALRCGRSCPHSGRSVCPPQRRWRSWQK